MTGYAQADDVVAWCNANPDAWNLVTYVWTLREELTHDGRRPD